MRAWIRKREGVFRSVVGVVFWLFFVLFSKEVDETCGWGCRCRRGLRGGGRGAVSGDEEGVNYGNYGRGGEGSGWREKEREGMKG